MTKTDFSKILKSSVVFVLIAAMALALFSCAGKTDDETEAPVISGEITVGDDTTDSTESDSAAESTNAEIQRKHTINVVIVDDKGQKLNFEVKTDADNLGDALIGAGLVKGEQGDYGLYIKYVCDIRADYEQDGAYWQLTKGGEYLMTGADSTPIADGETYELTYTKG